jgi:hypothetical protein
MQALERQIFRESALKHYIQIQEKDVVLRILPVPAAVFLWVLLGFLFMAGMFTWNERIPTYVSGSGIVQATSGGDAVAVIFLPAEQATALHSGMPVQIHVGATGPQVQSTILEVDQDITSPETARRTYQLEGESSSLVTEPTTVIVARLGATVPARIYAGSSLTANVEVGSQRILSILPGIGKLVGN